MLLTNLVASGSIEEQVLRVLEAIPGTRLDSAHPPVALAACVIRLVAYRAGGKATFASAADHFRLPGEDVRRAGRAVRPLLALGPGRPW